MLVRAIKLYKSSLVGLQEQETQLAFRQCNALERTIWVAMTVDPPCDSCRNLIHVSLSVLKLFLLIESLKTVFGHIPNSKLCINTSNFYKISISVCCSILAVQLSLWGEALVFFPCSSNLSWFTSTELLIHTGGRNTNLHCAHRHDLTQAISNSVMRVGSYFMDNH